MKAIEVIGLAKAYGSRRALEGVSFDVEEGDAVALVGANGAGKTTLLRILATLLKPSGGYARVMGMDGRFQAARIRRAIGYMPDRASMEDDLGVEEYLDFFAGIHGLGGAGRKECVRGLVTLLGLEEVREQACGSLSRGMQQRVGLARTLIHNPPILLLDEPAANLDPRARIEIREVLKELRRMGKTIVISSHILVELAELCNKLVLIDQGKLVYSGSVAEVAGRLRPRKKIRVQVLGDGGRFREALKSEPDVEDVREAEGWLTVLLKEGVGDYSFILKRVNQEGVTLHAMHEEAAGLEEIFMRLTGRKEGP